MLIALLRLQKQTTYQQNKHTNCKKWHRAVSCGENEIASGLQAHAHQSGQYFSGIALICRTVINISGL